MMYEIYQISYTSFAVMLPIGWDLSVLALPENCRIQLLLTFFNLSSSYHLSKNALSLIFSFISFTNISSIKLM